MERSVGIMFALPILLLIALSLLSGIVMIVGGLKMLRLQSYGWAMTACILAVLPFNPVGVIGLAIGIWGLVVLNQPGVRAAFRGAAGGPAASQPPGRGGGLWWVAIALVCVALLALIPVAAILAYFLMHA
mgnify:CR=1 FL=1